MSVCPSRMSESGRESLLDVQGGREPLPYVRKWSGVPPRFAGVVGRPSQMSRSGQEALPDVSESLLYI